VPPSNSTYCLPWPPRSVRTGTMRRRWPGRTSNFGVPLKAADVIGQAKGMLMERFDVDAAAAFGVLTRLSQESNTRLVHVAQKLIELDHPST